MTGGGCSCKPQGKSVGMCEPPRRKFAQGELVEVFFPAPFGNCWVGGYQVNREWINKRERKHWIDCRQIGRRIGGHVEPERVRKLRPGTPWVTWGTR